MNALGWILLSIPVLAVLVGPAFAVASVDGWPEALKQMAIVLPLTVVGAGLIVLGAVMIAGAP